MNPKNSKMGGNPGVLSGAEGGVMVGTRNEPKQARGRNREGSMHRNILLTHAHAHSLMHAYIHKHTHELTSVWFHVLVLKNSLPSTHTCVCTKTTHSQARMHSPICAHKHS